jgi:hypothetical protein
MGESSRTGLLDLEKELTCSICTEILYQPLTLLDCLHTFCGSCLKLWFVWQAQNNKDRRSNPYNCPSCRAAVRGTRPDAKINTLLDMYLQANPDKSKSDQEKEEMREKYKPGDDVIPAVTQARDSQGHSGRHAGRDMNSADRRMVEEVRAMSLRDTTANRSTEGYERGTRHRRRSREGRANSAAREQERARARQIEHQSSLRSLISSSDVDSTEMEEEILRQIMEDGLLDGIDLQNLDTMQEDELSERIAEAYRSRHGQGRSRQRSHDRRRGDERRAESRSRQAQPQLPSRPGPASEPRESSRRHARSTSTTETQTTTTTHSSHPPISRPHLFEAYPAHQGHRRRATSESRRQTSPIPGHAASTNNAAARSATDLSQRPRMSEQRERRPSDVPTHTRRSTDPRPRRLSDGSRSANAPIPAVDARRRNSPRGTGSPLLSPATNTSFPQYVDSPISGSRMPRSNPSDSPRSSSAILAQDANRSRPSSSSSAQVRARPTLYLEPLISCNACGKQEIQYELHFNCAVCESGNWNLCHRCYRAGRGCLHYFGFGNAAWHRFQTKAEAGSELPHALTGAQYNRPRPGSVQPPSSNISVGQKYTTDNPANRLMNGAFCYICHSHASSTFLYCGTCNDGEWGYCNTCVNTGRVCSHPLIPLAHFGAALLPPPSSNPDRHSLPHSTPSFAPGSMMSFPPSNLAPSGQFRPISFNTNCSICTMPISHRQNRFHCYQCNGGDYDICTQCYGSLQESGRITRENGERGWRRCPQGHRMVVVFFDDSIGGQSGQRRVITRDLVGGIFLDDTPGSSDLSGPTSPPPETGIGTYSWIEGEERKTRRLERRFANPESGRKFPPDGGVGARLLGLWTWLPAEGVKDELSFPRGAEIREALEISSEWYQGSYAGSKGVFPSNHVKVVDVVTM